jgi:hypothetical protein
MLNSGMLQSQAHYDGPAVLINDLYIFWQDLVTLLF